MKAYEGTEVLHPHTLTQQWNTINQYIRKFSQYQLFSKQIPVLVICALGTAGSNFRLLTFHIPGVRMKCIQNKKFISRKLIVIHVSALCHRKEKLRKFFHARLTCMRRPHFCHPVRNHLDRELAGRWIGRGGPIAWPSRSPDLTPLDFVLWGYVKNIVYQVKINHLQHPRARIRDTVATVTPNMLQATWNEVGYRLDICRATKRAHIEIYWDSYICRKKTLIVSVCIGVAHKCV
jgi:hypothetical protein